MNLSLRIHLIIHTRIILIMKLKKYVVSSNNYLWFHLWYPINEKYYFISNVKGTDTK